MRRRAGVDVWVLWKDLMRAAAAFPTKPGSIRARPQRTHRSTTPIDLPPLGLQMAARAGCPNQCRPNLVACCAPCCFHHADAAPAAIRRLPNPAAAAAPSQPPAGCCPSHVIDAGCGGGAVAAAIWNVCLGWPTLKRTTADLDSMLEMIDDAAAPRSWLACGCGRRKGIMGIVPRTCTAFDPRQAHAVVTNDCIRS